MKVYNKTKRELMVSSGYENDISSSGVGILKPQDSLLIPIEHDWINIQEV